MEIHYLNSIGQEKILTDIVYLQNIDNVNLVALTRSEKELKLRIDRIEGVYDDKQLEVHGVDLRIPCIRKINSPLGEFEAVYINQQGLIQECIVNRKIEGWLMIKQNGDLSCRKLAELQLERSGE